MDFGEKLRTLRRGKGLSQEELADLVGVSRQALSKWESNQTQPELDKLILLSGIFDVTIDSMIKEEKTIQDNPAPVASEVTSATSVALEKRQRLRVPLDSKGPFVAATFLLIAALTFVFNVLRFNDNIQTLQLLFVSILPLSWMALAVLLIFFVKRSPRALAIPLGVWVGMELIVMISMVIEFFRYRSVSWFVSAFEGLSQLIIPLFFIFVVLGKIKKREWPIILCAAYFLIRMGLNVFFSLFGFAEVVGLDISSIPLLALLFFALSLSNDPKRTYHSKYMIQQNIQNTNL